jgi:hypothetical protein
MSVTENDAFGGFLLGLVLAIVIIAPVSCCTENVARQDTLNQVSPCDAGVLKELKASPTLLGNENWACSFGGWHKQ